MLLFSTVFIQADSIKNSYILEAQGKYVQAYKLMNTLSINDSRNYLAHLRAGWLAYLSGYLSKSIYYYRKAIVLAPDAIDPGPGLKLPLIPLGHQKQAQTTGLSILRKDAANLTVRSRLAWSYYLAGNYKRSEIYYKAIIKHYPANGEMHIGLAWALIKQSKKKKARKILNLADKILPGNARVKATYKAL